MPLLNTRDATNAYYPRNRDIGYGGMASDGTTTGPAQLLRHIRRATDGEAAGASVRAAQVTRQAVQ